MSFAHEMHVLELESQTELLERLRLLTRFGSNLINLTGPAGAGKTWLAQRFLEAYAQDKNQALLMCHPHQTDEQKRTILLNQVVGEALFNQHDPLIESFGHLIGDQMCDLVIAVDDADRLSGDLIAELWTLVLEAQANPSWNINVVMFSTGNSLESVLSRLSYGQELKPIALEIEPLREHETEMFTELQVMHLVVGEDARKRVRKDVKKAPPLPGALMALGERKVERKIIIRSIIGSPLKIALMALILLLLVAGGYIWLLTQPGPEEKLQVLSDEGVVTTQAEQMVLDENGQSNLEQTRVENQPAQDDDATDDAGALPPSITTDAASVGSSDEGQRVVVPDTVVDALLEGDTTAQTQVIDQAIDLARQQAVLSDADLPEQIELLPAVEEIPQVADVAPVEAEVQAAQDAPPLVTFSFARDELLAVSDRNYTLQLAAMLSLDEVQDFLLVHEMQGQVRIYPTVRAGVDWYIVTYKDYPTIQQARDARAELPQSVQILEPWAKSMLQVHREIARAN